MCVSWGFSGQKPARSASAGQFIAEVGIAERTCSLCIRSLFMHTQGKNVARCRLALLRIFQLVCSRVRDFGFLSSCQTFDCPRIHHRAALGNKHKHLVTRPKKNHGKIYLPNLFITKKTNKKTVSASTEVGLAAEKFFFFLLLAVRVKFSHKN